MDKLTIALLAIVALQLPFVFFAFTIASLVRDLADKVYGRVSRSR